MARHADRGRARHGRVRRIRRRTDGAGGVEAGKPDLVIIDLALRDGSGIDLIKAVHLRHPAMRVIVFSMHAETTHAERAVRAGAHGYITKTQSSGNMVAAIREVLAGRVYLSDQVKKL